MPFHAVVICQFFHYQYAWSYILLYWTPSAISQPSHKAYSDPVEVDSICCIGHFSKYLNVVGKHEYNADELIFQVIDKDHKQQSAEHCTLRYATLHICPLWTTRLYEPFAFYLWAMMQSISPLDHLFREPAAWLTNTCGGLCWRPLQSRGIWGCGYKA